MENIKDTTFDFTLVLRQMYTEEILREKLKSVGVSYYQGMECVGFDCDPNKAPDGFPMTSTYQNAVTGETFYLKR
jgi:phenol 2-monooxygenase